MRWLFSLILGLAGVLCLAALPAIGQRETARIAAREPFYAAPIPSQNGFNLRNDSWGKGAFGASRNGGRKHQGVDLIAPVGAPVFAAKSGRISAAIFEKGYGLYVEILHADGLKTRYAHLSTLDVIKGQWIWQGSVLGAVGKTGNAANPHINPHLHFEIRNDKESLNPSKGLLAPTIVIN